MVATVRGIRDDDPDLLLAAFEGTPWERRGLAYFELLLRRHDAGARVVLVGCVDAVPVGHVSVVWVSDYPPFRDGQTPEIQDLTVSPGARRKGVASMLLGRAEGVAAERSTRVGIGVGLHAGYGAAQRLYVRRGFVPDGRGLVRRGVVVAEGERVPLDDDSVLYFTKPLP